MARRGREDTQAPAQPGPCASVAESPALPGHPTASTTKGLNEGPLTPLPGVSRHWQKQKLAHLFLPTSGKKRRDTLHQRKHKNILNTNTLALTPSL